MSKTKNYHLYLTDDDTEKFLDWRNAINGATNSNMIKIDEALGGKVDKVDGKGLSTEDFTTAEKTKLAGLENYTLPAATVDTLGGVKVGNGLTMTDGVLSSTGLSQEQGDGRYLKLSGGTVNGVFRLKTKRLQFAMDSDQMMDGGPGDTYLCYEDGVFKFMKFPNEGTMPGTPSTLQRLQVAAPVSENDVTTKKYVDNAMKRDRVDTSLLASGWTESEGEFVQTISVNGLGAEQDGDISVAPSATKEQRSAAARAALFVTGQAAGSLTITADGVVPEIDIPVQITLL